MLNRIFHALLPLTALVAAALVLSAVPTKAEHVTYHGIDVPNAKVLLQEDGKSLVHTQSSLGSGAVWLNSKLIEVKQGDPPPSFEEQLKQAREWLQAEEFQRAHDTLKQAVRRAPGNREGRLLYAQALRRLWRFEPAYYLVQSVIEEDLEQSSRDDVEYALWVEAAELAVLWGDRSATRDATNALLVQARNQEDDNAARDYVGALKDQQKGRRVVVTAEGRLGRDPSEIAKERANFDISKGDCILSAAIAERCEEILKREDSQIGVQCYVYITAMPEKALLHYRMAGDEIKFRAAIDACRIRVRVHGSRWRKLYDWRKRAMLSACFFELKRIYRNATCTVSVGGWGRDPTDPIEALASATDSSGAVQYTLETNEYRDNARDLALRNEAQERRRKRNR